MNAVVLPDIKKIVVLRSNAIGDYLFCLPALEALAETYPGTEIVLLGKQWHAGFLANRPGPVRRVEVVPFLKGVNEPPPGTKEDPARIADFFKRMQNEKFDLALQLFGGGRFSNPLVKKLGARTTAGLQTPDAVPLDRNTPYVYYQNEVLRYLETVSLVGAKTGRLEPRLGLKPADLSEAKKFVPETKQPLAVLHPGATDPRRRWLPEKFSQTGNALAARGARTIITGLPEEKEICKQVFAGVKKNKTNLCGQLSLSGLTGLLSRAKVVIANDTGPLHLARAVGAATVGIYWIGNVINAGPLTSRNHRCFFSWRTICPVCGVSCIDSSCRHRDSFVAEVKEEDVTQAALELFSQV